VPALLRCLFLLLFLFVAPVHGGLPSLLGSSAPAQPEATEPLGKSLDEVIKNLENDQQRAKLLADLKSCATPPKIATHRRTRRARPDRRRPADFESSSPATTARSTAGPQEFEPGPG
jgi:hypothetical protein